MSIESIISELASAAAHPGKQLADFKVQGKKVIGILPYYVPEELVYAAGMTPMGIWGNNDKIISMAKEYCVTFYCTIAQLGFEMLLDGTFDQLDGVITLTVCDTLRPMSQNIRVAMAKYEKMPIVFLAHPQNRKPAYGLKFCVDQYINTRKALEEVGGAPITGEAIQNAIKVYNKSCAARRELVKLAGEHCDMIAPTKRSVVLKASWFTLKDEYTEKLEALNEELGKLPACDWKGVEVVISGITCDNPTLLKIFEDNNVATAADDVAQESRSFRADAPEDQADPTMALAPQFASLDRDVLFYDEHSSGNRRGEFVANMVKENDAQGLILFVQRFCNPEGMEYPSLRKALNETGMMRIKLSIDQQMRDFGQAATAIQAFADVLKSL